MPWHIRYLQPSTDATGAGYPQYIHILALGPLSNGPMPRIDDILTGR
jgi:hypothetical protein